MNSPKGAVRDGLLDLIVRIHIAVNADGHIIFAFMIDHERTFVDAALVDLLTVLAIHTRFYGVIAGVGKLHHRRIIGRKPVFHLHAINERAFAVIVIIAEIQILIPRYGIEERARVESVRTREAGILFLHFRDDGIVRRHVEYGFSRGEQVAVGVLSSVGGHEGTVGRFRVSHRQAEPVVRILIKGVIEHIIQLRLGIVNDFGRPIVVDGPRHFIIGLEGDPRAIPNGKILERQD